MYRRNQDQVLGFLTKLKPVAGAGANRLTPSSVAAVGWPESKLWPPYVAVFNSTTTVVTSQGGEGLRSAAAIGGRGPSESQLHAAATDRISKGGGNPIVEPRRHRHHTRRKP
jgi:hypothetical protein